MKTKLLKRLRDEAGYVFIPIVDKRAIVVCIKNGICIMLWYESLDKLFGNLEGMYIVYICQRIDQMRARPLYRIKRAITRCLRSSFKKE